jgi:hypothetical protein
MDLKSMICILKIFLEDNSVNDMLLAKLIHNSLKSSLMGAIVCLGLGKKNLL